VGQALASGEKNALDQLFNILAEVVKGISGNAFSDASKAALGAYFTNAFAG
jgi:hypothetical protein